jgi:glucose-1-phosphate adenylyltransferase
MFMQEVLALILGGGSGTRLYPLTRDRAKPAVPLAGKYRLIDVPISNCFHAGIEKIAILTQFKSVSLHRHMYRTYSRDKFTKGWVQILAAEQTHQSTSWYRGTADAVRQQIVEIKSAETPYVLILAGDHLYRMDYRRFVEYHIKTKSDLTIAVQPVAAELAPALGILKRQSDGRIDEFFEKPNSRDLTNLISDATSNKPYMASMGIYVFSTDFLLDMLAEKGDDFGKDIIPLAMQKGHRVMGYIFDGYWADIGTIRRFYEVNLEMILPNSPFDFWDPYCPIYTRSRFLPPSEINGATLEGVMLTEGCRIADAHISHSVVGLRSIIGSSAKVKASIIIGADFYESEAALSENKKLARPNIGIGAGSVINGAIVDKNARIGRNVRIFCKPKRKDEKHPNWVAKDGLIIIPKNAIISDNTVI